MIGLEKGIVRVAPHHSSWRNAFEQERRVLQEHIGCHVLDVQHVGSTAVPGLAARPIIDFAVVAQVGLGLTGGGKLIGPRIGDETYSRWLAVNDRNLADER